MSLEGIDFKYDVEILFNNYKRFLIEKNKRYGNSALKPIQIFSKDGAETQICNRIDDKLSRIKSVRELKKNDVCDLFGYLALLMIKKKWNTFDEMLD